MTGIEEIGNNLATLRKAQGLTLEMLSKRSGISRAAISALENGSSNPRVATIWSLAKALGVEFSELIGQSGDIEIREENGIKVKLIDKQNIPRTIETYMMELPPHSCRKAAVHPYGVRESVVVLAGQLMAGPERKAVPLQAGQVHQFQGDIPHIYSAAEDAAKAIVSVIYPEQNVRLNAETQILEWPADNSGWQYVHKIIQRAKADVQSGCTNIQIRFRNVPEHAKATAEIRSKRLVSDTTSWNRSRMYITAEPAPTIYVLYRTPAASALATDVYKNSPLSRHLDKWAPIASSRGQLAAGEIQELQQTVDKSRSLFEAALAAEVLTQRHSPTAPAFVWQKITDHGKPVEKHKRNAQKESDSYSNFDVLRPGSVMQLLAVAASIAKLTAEETKTAIYSGSSDDVQLQMLQDLLPDLALITSEGINSDKSRPTQALTKEDISNSPQNYPLQSQEQRLKLIISIDPTTLINPQEYFEHISSLLKTNGRLILTSEMLSPFTNPQERSKALITHHLWHILDTLYPTANSTSDAARDIEYILNQNIPAAMSMALSENTESAAHLLRETYKEISEAVLAEESDPSRKAFSLFHIDELHILLAALDGLTPTKTYPARLISLAQSNGLMLKNHQRVYATHGDIDYDAGTHLFVLEKQ